MDLKVDLNLPSAQARRHVFFLHGAAHAGDICVRGENKSRPYGATSTTSTHETRQRTRGVFTAAGDFPDVHCSKHTRVSTKTQKATAVKKNRFILFNNAVYLGKIASG